MELSQENNTKSDEALFTLNKKEVRYIKKVVDNPDFSKDQKIENISNFMGVSIEDSLEMINFLKLSLKPTQFSKARSKTLEKKRRYIISSAQSASSVNLNFLRNIEIYANFINAEIGIIATRYKNPTSIWKEEGDVWDKSVEEYLIAKKQQIHDDVLILADLKIQATAPNPTSGIELFGNHASLIVGSPKIEMRSVPVLPTQKQKFLYSTGSTTYPNFTDTVAGGKAGAHHSFGFVIIEIESDEVVHIRNVSANEDGDFNDLIYRVEDGEVFEESVEVFVWGDSHFAKKEERVTEAFRKLCMDLGVSVSVLHDVWDSESLNIHNFSKPIEQYRLYKDGKADLRAELNQMFSELEWFENNMEDTIVVRSNHDDMLDRALEIPDLWAKNLMNAEIIIEFLQMKLAGDCSDGVISELINNEFASIRALGLNDSYMLYDVELGLHGHKGPNGSRGSAKAFSRLSTKTIVGHTHSPSITGGCYQVGIACSMEHGYNAGLSGWAYAGATLNQHGKRQMIVFNKQTLTYTTLY